MVCNNLYTAKSLTKLQFDMDSPVQPPAHRSPAAARFFAVSELVILTLLQDPISALQLEEKLLLVNKQFNALIKDTYSLQRKTFKRIAKPTSKTTNDTTTLNARMIPANFGWKPFDTDFAKKEVVIAISSVPGIVFNLHWATFEDLYPVLCVESFQTTFTNYEVPKQATLATFLSNINIGIVVMVKCQVDGEEVESRLCVPGSGTIHQVLTATARWSSGTFTQESGVDANGVYVDGYL